MFSGLHRGKLVEKGHEVLFTFIESNFIGGVALDYDNAARKKFEISFR
jgi:hypothetical protein